MTFYRHAGHYELPENIFSDTIHQGFRLTPKEGQQNMWHNNCVVAQAVWCVHMVVRIWQLT